MESSWIRCEYMRDQEKSCYRRLMKQENHRRKTLPIVVKCGRRFRRCLPMCVRRDWLTCSSTAGSNPGRLCVSVHKNSVIYKKFTACVAASWSDCFVMQINCDGG